MLLGADRSIDSSALIDGFPPLLLQVGELAGIAVGAAVTLNILVAG